MEQPYCFSLLITHDLVNRYCDYVKGCWLDQNLSFIIDDMVACLYRGATGERILRELGKRC